MKTTLHSSSSSPHNSSQLWKLPQRQLPSVVVVGKHDYDVIVAQHHRAPKALIAAHLIAQFREDFQVAATNFSRDEWLFLVYQAAYSLHALVEPSFDPRAPLTHYAQQACPLGLPQGLSEANHALCSKTVPTLIKALDVDVAKAAWCIVSVVKSLEASAEFLEHAQWWTIEWLRNRLPILHHWKIVRPAALLLDPVEDIPI